MKVEQVAAPTTVHEEDWMTPVQAANELKVSVYTVRRLCRQHKLVAFQAGHMWRILRSAIIEKAQANVQEKGRVPTL